jgi:hypothetical protein
MKLKKKSILQKDPKQKIVIKNDDQIWKKKDNLKFWIKE